MNIPKYNPPPMPDVKPPANPCIYYDICPSASGWCNNKQPSEMCVSFLDNVENGLKAKIMTIHSIKQYIEGRRENNDN